MRKVLALGAVVAVLAPSILFAAFPLALLPGIALVFESGTMATAYASAIALVGSALTWFYFAPSPPAVTQAPLSKVEVRFKAGEIATLPPNSEYQEIDVDEGTIVPNNVVPYRSGVANFSSNSFYQNDNVQLRDVYRCTVKEGCATQISTRLYDERNWVHQSSTRYLLFNFNGQTVKIDPHNVASFDNVTSLEYGGCPSGYGSYNPSNQTCSGVSTDNGRVATESDGVCSYVYDQTIKRFKIDPASYLYGDTYLMDPDCYGKPQNTSDLNLGQGNHTANLSVNGTGYVSIKERKIDQQNRVADTEYVLRPEAGRMKLDGGTYNNVTDPGSGTDPGDGEAGGGSGGDTGGGSCGGAGQPACDIDDSGFQGAEAGTGLTEALTAIDARSDALTDFADSGVDIDSAWLPSLKPGLQVQCSPLLLQPAISHGPAAGLGGTFELDICDKLSTVREIIAWLFGLFTVFYVWRKFVNSNGAL